MTDGMLCANCLSQYQEILSKTRLFGTGKCSKLGRTLYIESNTNQNVEGMRFLKMTITTKYTWAQLFKASLA